MESYAVVEKLGKYKELALLTVLVYMGGQEFLEVLALEFPTAVQTRFSRSLLLHLSQVLMILGVIYVFIKAWQEKTWLMAQGAKRSHALETLIEALREKEQTLADMMERLISSRSAMLNASK